LLKIIGKEGCSRCKTVVSILENKNLEFEYIDIKSLEPPKRAQYLREADTKGERSLPILVKNDKVVLLSEIGE
jgi:glutaredoxin